MTKRTLRPLLTASALCAATFPAFAESNVVIGDAVIAAQRAALAASTNGAGFGPQSPRDLSTLRGNNPRSFETAPPASDMNLCNIHVHKNAEHKGGEFTRYAGNGNGKGYDTGYRYNGPLTVGELTPLGRPVGANDYTALKPGDTIEVHYVHTTAQVSPGPTLGACLSESIANPQLRVEAQVFVLVNDDNAADFVALAEVSKIGDYHQAPNIPTNTGTPIAYNGSTTGPSFNSEGSPFQVSWSVRPEVMKLSITSVEAWMSDNIFDEHHAHGVRNLVVNPKLLSDIE